MMSDEDIKEFHNIGQKPGLKKSNKYNYMQGKQITDPDTGKRVYEINNYRLPSVTTISVSYTHLTLPTILRV